MISLNNVIVTEIIEIATVSSPSGRYIEIKNRFSYGLSFCKSGRITYTHNGKKFVSDKNCAIFLPKGQSYTLYANESGSFPLINFECIGLGLDRFSVIPLNNPESYLKAYDRIKNLSLFENTKTEILSIFYDILSRLQRENSNVSSMLGPALSYIEANYADPQLNNKLLAENSHISEVYFRRIFREALGTTPKQYITDIRIRKAKQLLGQSGLTVTAASEQCGFSSVYHFCRIFKEKTGFTPTEYIKSTQSYGL